MSSLKRTGFVNIRNGISESMTRNLKAPRRDTNSLMATSWMFIAVLCLQRRAERGNTNILTSSALPFTCWE